MANLNELKPVGKLNPFGKFCCTIGELPTSYMISLTYEEQLLWLCKYLEETVIPAVNTNAEAVAELQELYIELKNYVDNYFENLDVQEEINNKLDAMALDGTLEKIINQDIFGKINDNLDIINSNDTIFIGDSYGDGIGPSKVIGWCQILKEKMGLSNDSSYIWAVGGSGFVDETPESFIQIVQNRINSIKNKKLIKNVIVCGGYNDRSYDVDLIQSKILEFTNYINEQFPNATIYIGHIGYNTAHTDGYAQTRTALIIHSMQAYINLPHECKNTVYLSGVEFSVMDGNLIQSDYVHPTQEGQKIIADNIYQAMNGGKSNSLNSNNATLKFYHSDSEVKVLEYVSNELIRLRIPNIDVTFSQKLRCDSANVGIDIGVIDNLRFVFPHDTSSSIIPITSFAGNSETGKYAGGPAHLIIQPTGVVTLFPLYVGNDGFELIYLDRIKIIPTYHTYSRILM